MNVHVVTINIFFVIYFFPRKQIVEILIHFRSKTSIEFRIYISMLNSRAI